MARVRIALPVALMAALLALPAVTQESDPLPAETQESDALESNPPESDALGKGGSDCICPKEGHWKMPNLKGSFKCKGAVVFNRKLKELIKWGTTVMMKEDCTVIFGDGKKKKDEEGMMFRVEGCGYEGVIQGAEQGVEINFEAVWEVHSPEHITGVMTGDVSDKGMSCEVYRPFEMDWMEPLSEAEYKREIKEGEELAERMRKKQQGK